MPPPTSIVSAADEPSLWVTISELARIKGVDKAWISRRVAKWEDDKQIVTRPGPRGSKLVNRAEYDRLANEVGDLAKVQAAETARDNRDAPDLLPLDPQSDQPKDQTYTAAQRERAKYETELKKLDLAERRGLVVAIVKLTEALHQLADAIVQLIDRLPLRAAEVAAAVAKDGESGARAVLKVIAHDLRANAAAAFRNLQIEGQAEEASGIEVDFEDTDT